MAQSVYPAVVPTDATKANLASPTFTGTVTIPTGALITSPTIVTPTIVSMSGVQTINGGDPGSSINLFSNHTSNSLFIGANQTTGSINIGYTQGTVSLLPAASTTNKTVNIATGSTAGTTTVNIGSTAGATSNVTISGTAIPASKTLVATDSTQYVVPSQTSNSGKYLTTNGTAASWASIVTDPTPSIFMLMGA